jgi:hypothetical protein
MIKETEKDHGFENAFIPSISTNSRVIKIKKNIFFAY